MKRFHVHVAVESLTESIRFYAALFGSAPSVVKEDYAKWMLDEPRINFAISARGQSPGVNHLGFQVESDEELEEIHGRLLTADSAIKAEQGVDCCYAKSDKYWVTDPQGVAWESFRSLGSVPLFGGSVPPAAAGSIASPVQSAAAAPVQTTSCCAPQAVAIGSKKSRCCG